MSTLTSEQRARIERNRLAALQRRSAWKMQQQMQSNFKQYPSHQTFRTNRKRKYSEIQNPSKLPLQPIIPQNSISYNKSINHNTKCHSPQKKRRKLVENTNINTTKRHQTTSTSNPSQNTNRNRMYNTQYQSKPKRSKHRKKSKNNNLITSYLNHTKNTNKKRIKSTKSIKSNKYTKNNKKSSKYIYKSNNHLQWRPLSKQILFNRLSHSKFRSKFKLGAKEINIVHTKDIESHAYDFVTKRLSAAKPTNDGKQTPMRGHPVFIAQHATATCCRTCLSKWHSIKLGNALTREQIAYMVEVILHWIKLKTPH